MRQAGDRLRPGPPVIGPHLWSSINLAADLESAACSPSASASAASTARTGKPRTNEAITSDSSAFVVTYDPDNRDANASVVPRSFGLDSCTGPAVVLTVTSRYPLREPGRASSQAAAAAEELRDLSFETGRWSWDVWREALVIPG